MTTPSSPNPASPPAPHSSPTRILLHYSVPNLPPHAGRTPSLSDARTLAATIAARTLAPVTISAHYAEGGVEVIEEQETVMPRA